MVGSAGLEDGADPVPEPAALVADLLLRADVLLGVGVGGLAHRLLQLPERDDLLGLGLALDADLDPVLKWASDLRYRRRTFDAAVSALASG